MQYGELREIEVIGVFFMEKIVWVKNKMFTDEGDGKMQLRIREMSLASSSDA